MLAKLLAKRDPAALEHLYQYARLLEIVLYRRFGRRFSPEDREDIVADALIHAWQTGDRFDPRLSSLKTWLIMLVTYQARAFLRRNGGYDHVPLDEVAEGIAAPDHISHEDRQHHPSDTMARVLARLSARRAKVLEMYYYDRQAIVEIAHELQITEATVRSHLCLARSSLRRELEAEQAA
jgi:RNA polymerase sigma factor (sigma-70 family)